MPLSTQITNSFMSAWDHTGKIPIPLFLEMYRFGKKRFKYLCNIAISTRRTFLSYAILGDTAFDLDTHLPDREKKFNYCRL